MPTAFRKAGTPIANRRSDQTADGLKSGVGSRSKDELFSAALPRMARERTELSPPMRNHPFKAHLVAYRIERDGDILIVRVRRGYETGRATHFKQGTTSSVPSPLFYRSTRRLPAAGVRRSFA
ncbi:type II toxin-antitoxin system RelE/ParE family toxin [Ensifer adhaerens]|uniref:type II toxin-antitoxin system RelE/ParE family toxin n=1 Tax=Ensifer adhaerens TaxID=106592 RepID=UPI003D00B523